MTNDKPLFSQFRHVLKMNTDSQRVEAIFRICPNNERTKRVDKFGKRFERNKYIDKKKSVVISPMPTSKHNWTKLKAKKKVCFKGPRSGLPNTLAENNEYFFSVFVVFVYLFILWDDR